MREQQEIGTKREVTECINGGGDDEPRPIFETANQGHKRQQVHQGQRFGTAGIEKGTDNRILAFEVTVVGLQHHEAAGELLPSSYAVHPRLYLRREPENEHDENAIAVIMLPASSHQDDEGGTRSKVGYIERKQAYLLAPLLDETDDEAVTLHSETCAFPPCIRVVDVKILLAMPGKTCDDNARENDREGPYRGIATPTAVPKSLKLGVTVHVSRQDVWHALQQAFPSYVMRSKEAVCEQDEGEIARAQQARNLQALKM